MILDNFKRLFSTQISRSTPINIQLHIFLKTGYCNPAHTEQAIFNFPKTCLDSALFSHLGKATRCNTGLAQLNTFLLLQTRCRGVYGIRSQYSCRQCITFTKTYFISTSIAFIIDLQVILAHQFQEVLGIQFYLPGLEHPCEKEC